MEEFPLHRLPGGTSGRRAALAGGPDIWELMATLKSGTGRGEEVITATADLLNLTGSQVRTAARYYRAFSYDIDRRITRNSADADEAKSAWQREPAMSA